LSIPWCKTQSGPGKRSAAGTAVAVRGANPALHGQPQDPRRLAMEPEQLPGERCLTPNVQFTSTRSCPAAGPPAGHDARLAPAAISAVRYAADSAAQRRSRTGCSVSAATLERALCVFGDPRRAGLRVLLWSRAPRGPVGWWSWPVSGRARCPARAGQGGGGGADSGGRPRRSRRCAMSSGARRGLPYQAIGEKETQGGCS
jgi:hypothetical protein